MNEQIIGSTLEYSVELSHGPYEALLRAVQPIRAREVVFYLGGRIVTAPTKYTLQLDAGRHLLADNELWQFMNHGCEPCVRIDVDTRQMIAIRDVARGEELTFNYNTTEWDMAAPFDCNCGDENCTGRIRGFRYLTPAQRAALRPWLSPLIESRFSRHD